MRAHYAVRTDYVTHKSVCSEVSHLVQVGGFEEADLVMRFQSQHTNVGCLQVLSGPGNPWIVNVHADTADM
jgi:hypothetical protein